MNFGVLWGAPTITNSRPESARRCNRRLKSRIAIHPRFFEFEDSVQRHVVLPPALPGGQGQVDLDQVQVEPRPDGFLDGWIGP